MIKTDLDNIIKYSLYAVGGGFATSAFMPIILSVLSETYGLDPNGTLATSLLTGIYLVGGLVMAGGLLVAVIAFLFRRASGAEGAKSPGGPIRKQTYQQQGFTAIATLAVAYLGSPLIAIGRLGVAIDIALYLAASILGELWAVGYWKARRTLLARIVLAVVTILAIYQLWLTALSSALLFTLRF